ncbi:MAG: glycosyl transferase, partial [Sulfitobacter sp.]
THPVALTLGPGVAWGMAIFFFAAETLNMTFSFYAVSGRQHRHLLAWVPTLLFYFPLGALASYKALYEMVRNPFYWDKTQHGVSDTPDQHSS